MDNPKPKTPEIQGRVQINTPAPVTNEDHRPKEPGAPVIVPQPTPEASTRVQTGGPAVLWRIPDENRRPTPSGAVPGNAAQLALVKEALLAAIKAAPYSGVDKSTIGELFKIGHMAGVPGELLNQIQADLDGAAKKPVNAVAKGAELAIVRASIVAALEFAPSAGLDKSAVSGLFDSARVAGVPDSTLKGIRADHAAGELHSGASDSMLAAIKAAQAVDAPFASVPQSMLDAIKGATAIVAHGSQPDGQGTVQGEVRVTGVLPDKAARLAIVQESLIATLKAGPFSGMKESALGELYQLAHDAGVSDATLKEIKTAVSAAAKKPVSAAAKDSELSVVKQSLLAAFEFAPSAGLKEATIGGIYKAVHDAGVSDAMLTAIKAAQLAGPPPLSKTTPMLEAIKAAQTAGAPLAGVSQPMLDAIHATQATGAQGTLSAGQYTSLEHLIGAMSAIPGTGAASVGTQGSQPPNNGNNPFIQLSQGSN